MNKIEEHELSILRDLNSKFNKSRSKLADIEIAIRNLEVQKSNVFAQMDETGTSFKNVEAEMLEKYGKVEINLQTGEIKDDKN
jgi:hypothetical protein